MYKRMMVCLAMLAVGATVATAANVSFFDNFDSYAAGSYAGSQGGWQGWDSAPAAGEAPITNAFSFSSPNSVNIEGDTDLVHMFSATSGKWVLSGQMLIPTGSTGATYWIVMNNYIDGGPDAWSGQLTFDMDPNGPNHVGELVRDDFAPGLPTLPIVRDRWAEIKMEVDLDANTATTWYDGQFLSGPRQWFNPAGTDDRQSIAAIDLYAGGAQSVFYDDIRLEEIRLEDVPEPATLALLSFGAVAVLIRRKK